ncbi:MAG: hypothetical protein E7624_01800 [Ruminococcaceae bacterium]|nr:hypothetical protein [Oscillospiraceae bacterium]
MLKAGFARLDMTPPFGSPLAGYYETREAEGVLDPVYLNALALNEGEKTIIVITADVLIIRMDVCDTLRAMIEERTGVPADHILINSLHPHTSLRIGGKPGPGTSIITDRAYLDVLYRKFCDVAQMAISDLADATYETAVQHAVADISFVRRYFMKDGVLKTNPGSHAPEEIDRPAARSDNDVRLVLFRREGVKDIALVNFATHPDVIGGKKISADWPGFARRFVEEDHKDVHCILMNGFQGDTNHINFMVEKEKRFPNGKRYLHSEYMGRVIADTVNLMWDKTVPEDKTGIFAEVSYIFNKCSTRGEEHYEECHAFYVKYKSGDYSEKETKSGIAMAEACRIARIPEQPVYHKIPITVLGMGKLAFFGIGGEPFTEYGYIAREAFPEKFVMTATCANGGEGYLPSQQAFSQGGYEVISSHFTDTLEKTVMDASLEMLGKF